MGFSAGSMTINLIIRRLFINASLTYLFISLTADNDFQKQNMSTINSHNVDETMEKYNITQ